MVSGSKKPCCFVLCSYLLIWLVLFVCCDHQVNTFSHCFALKPQCHFRYRVHSLLLKASIVIHLLGMYMFDEALGMIFLKEKLRAKKMHRGFTIVILLP